MKLILLWVLILAISTSSVFAGKDKDGGDSSEINLKSALTREELVELLDNGGELIKLLIIIPVIVNIDPEVDLKSVESYSKFNKMIRDGRDELLKDIKLSEYDFRSLECLSIKHSMATVSERNSKICINLNKILKEEITVEKLIGLLMHEHGHHFGVEHSDYCYENSPKSCSHAMATDIAKYIDRVWSDEITIMSIYIRILIDYHADRL